MSSSKLIADFEWLTFVLAMDCAAVARTIGRRFGGDDEGQRFLEKIIQVPVRLPTIPHAKLKEFTLGLIQEVINDLGIELDQSEVSLFRASFDPAIMPLIRTPRSAKQYANVIRFSLGLLPQEVNPVDVMLLEGMRSVPCALSLKGLRNILSPLLILTGWKIYGRGE